MFIETWRRNKSRHTHTHTRHIQCKQNEILIDVVKRSSPRFSFDEQVKQFKLNTTMTTTAIQWSHKFKQSFVLKFIFHISIRLCVSYGLQVSKASNIFAFFSHFSRQLHSIEAHCLSSRLCSLHHILSKWNVTAVDIEWLFSVCNVSTGRVKRKLENTFDIKKNHFRSH